MTVRDWITAAILVVLIGFALYVLVPAYARYRDTRMTIHEMEQSLQQQEGELMELKKELAALRTDYRAIERVARERFGLCREGEEIYHFETPAATEPTRPDTTQPQAP
jgi:cell division protein FtsB